MRSGALSRKTAVPWWAAFGAPLVGVPVLVALLALGTTGRADAGMGEAVNAEYATEQAEALQAEIDLPPVTFDRSVESQC